jgi:hypothetical protein
MVDDIDHRPRLRLRIGPGDLAGVDPEVTGADPAIAALPEDDAGGFGRGHGAILREITF